MYIKKIVSLALSQLPNLSTLKQLQHAVVQLNSLRKEQRELGRKAIASFIAKKTPAHLKEVETGLLLRAAQKLFSTQTKHYQIYIERKGLALRIFEMCSMSPCREHAAEALRRLQEWSAQPNSGRITWTEKRKFLAQALEHLNEAVADLILAQDRRLVMRDLVSTDAQIRIAIVNDRMAFMVEGNPDNLGLVYLENLDTYYFGPLSSHLLPHGNGTIYRLDGNYKTTFENGIPANQGIFEFLGRWHGLRYEGEFKDCKPHGRGTVYFRTGNHLEITWHEGTPSPYGTFYYEDGSRFEGAIVDYQPHGAGKRFYVDGKHYEGHFILGREHGLGILYSQSYYTIGEWEQGAIRGLYRNQFTNGAQEGHDLGSHTTVTQITQVYQDGLFIAGLREGHFVHRLHIYGCRALIVEAILNQKRLDGPDSGLFGEGGRVVVVECLAKESRDPTLNRQQHRILDKVRDHILRAYDALYLSADTIQTILRNSQTAPQVVMGGWSEHSVGYVIYKDTVYICNRGEGAGTYDTNDRLRVIRAATVTDMRTFLEQMAAQTRLKTEDVEALQTTLRPLLRPIQLPDSLGKLRGRQKMGNCWFQSTRTAAMVVMGLYAQDAGIAFEPLYQVSLSKSAMVTAQIQLWVTERRQTDPRYVPEQDKLLQRLLVGNHAKFQFVARAALSQSPTIKPYEKRLKIALKLLTSLFKNWRDIGVKELEILHKELEFLPLLPKHKDLLFKAAVHLLKSKKPEKQELGAKLLECCCRDTTSAMIRDYVELWIQKQPKQSLALKCFSQKALRHKNILALERMIKHARASLDCLQGIPRNVDHMVVQVDNKKQWIAFRYLDHSNDDEFAAYIFFDNGDRYEGTVNRNSKPQGYGTLFCINGEKYQGHWVLGKKEGVFTVWNHLGVKRQVIFRNDTEQGSIDMSTAASSSGGYTASLLAIPG
ncbi:MAG: hypothetical protein AB7F28_04915 [Candidatus Margulisiibacteriota bacterium]